MTLTRITEGNIKPGSITANSLAEGISLGGGGGGGGGVTIDQIIIADENFANTGNTYIKPYDTNYIKLYGSGFEANANVFISTPNIFKISDSSISFELGPKNTLEYEIQNEFITSNEIRLTHTISDVNYKAFNKYDLFLINQKGTSSIKLKSILVDANEPEGNHAWVVAGSAQPAAPVSRIRRISFASDTTSPSIRGPLSAARYYLHGTSNLDYGYIMAGRQVPGGLYVTNIDRIDYNNDTLTTAIRSFVINIIANSATVKNKTYSWALGGRNPSPGISTLVERFVFSSDTSNATFRSNLTVAKKSSASVYSPDYGWSVGGEIAIPFAEGSLVERLTFATDTSNATFRFNFPVTVSNCGFSSIKNYGYVWGGQGPQSRAYRINYSNETVNLVGNVGYFVAHPSVTNNQSYSWIIGGSSPAGQSRIVRFDMFNDTNDGIVSNLESNHRFGVAVNGKL